MTATGGCHCGGVRYAIEGDLAGVQFCHCADCRRVQGTVFASNVPVAVDAFRLTQGEGLLSAYESSPGKTRLFCRVCGSPIISRTVKDPAHVRVRAGTLDDGASPPLAFHFWCDDDPSWWDETAELPHLPGPKPAG